MLITYSPGGAKATVVSDMMLLPTSVYKQNKNKLTITSSSCKKIN